MNDHPDAESQALATEPPAILRAPRPARARPAEPPPRYPDFAATGPGTLAGRYLRRFWQPVRVSADLAVGQVVPIRIMGERFTLFRGESGLAQVLAPACAHRGTQLSTGSVEGDALRCLYHGWKYDRTGACVEQPAEHPCAAELVKIASYPTQEWSGLVFAYLGEGAPPPLPRLDALEGAGLVQASVLERRCNYFQQLENSVDEVHLNFAHRRSGFAEAGLNVALPDVDGDETGYGILRSGRRGDRLRRSHFLMPNILFNKVYDALAGWYDHLSWRVPVDDRSHLIFNADLMAVAPESRAQYLAATAERARALAAAPDANDVAEAILRGERTLREVEDHPDLINIQDLVVLIGQGVVADRERDHLGRSDVQVALLRRLWARELKALAAGRPLKRWEWPPDLTVTSGVEA